MAAPRFWAVVPAAGVGRRMGGDLPKQYLPLHGRPLLQHTLERLGGHPRIAGVVVALTAGDPYWRAPALGVPLYTVDGGAERCHSVLNALDLLHGTADPGDWVLVHDAARPCLRPADIDRLIAELAGHPVGGLLGLPVADTVKRVDAAGDVAATVPRDGLWRALTPQMFRLASLRDALARAVEAGELVTDEAGAIEGMGLHPRMVEGHADNIKVTRPGDLELAALYLEIQLRERAG
jgi:2-C-methyl-D-erythritol 4-phosphate cytidylyltransferase